VPILLCTAAGGLTAPLGPPPVHALSGTIVPAALMHCYAKSTVPVRRLRSMGADCL